MSGSKPRFWIDDDPPKGPFAWGCAVVDEEINAIIAYFATENDARLFVKALFEHEGITYDEHSPVHQ